MWYVCSSEAQVKKNMLLIDTSFHSVTRPQATELVDKGRSVSLFYNFRGCREGRGVIVGSFHCEEKMDVSPTDCRT